MTLKKTLAIESIAKQNDDTFKKIKDIIIKTRELKNFKYLSEEMTKLIKTRFGFDCFFEVENRNYFDFYSYTTEAVIGSALTNTPNKKNIGLFGSTKKSYVIDIDYKNAVIKINNPIMGTCIGLTTASIMAMNDSDYYLSEDEIAACILHEIGHTFNYFSYVLDTVRVITIARTRSAELIGYSKNQRIKLIGELDTDKMSPSDIDDILNAVTEQDAEIAIIRGAIRAKETTLGMSYYSIRACEQAADNFAIQFGVASSLASALSKLNSTERKADTKFNRYKDNMLAILSVIATFGASILVVGLFEVLFFSSDIYDYRKDRLIYIKREVINELKSTTLLERKKLLLSQIKFIDYLASLELEKNKGFNYYIAYFLSSKYRRNAKELKTMKDLESMIDNDLYVQSTQLKTL